MADAAVRCSDRSFPPLHYPVHTNHYRLYQVLLYTLLQSAITNDEAERRHLPSSSRRLFLPELEFLLDEFACRFAIPHGFRALRLVSYWHATAADAPVWTTDELPPQSGRRTCAAADSVQFLQDGI